MAGAAYHLDADADCRGARRIEKAVRPAPRSGGDQLSFAAAASAPEQGAAARLRRASSSRLRHPMHDEAAEIVTERSRRTGSGRHGAARYNADHPPGPAPKPPPKTAPERRSAADPDLAHSGRARPDAPLARRSGPRGLFHRPMNWSQDPGRARRTCDRDRHLLAVAYAPNFDELGDRHLIGPGTSSRGRCTSAA